MKVQSGISLYRRSDTMKRFASIVLILLSFGACKPGQCEGLDALVGEVGTHPAPDTETANALRPLIAHLEGAEGPELRILLERSEQLLEVLDSMESASPPRTVEERNARDARLGRFQEALESWQRSIPAAQQQCR